MTVTVQRSVLLVQHRPFRRSIQRWMWMSQTYRSGHSLIPGLPGIDAVNRCDECHNDDGKNDGGKHQHRCLGRCAINHLLLHSAAGLPVAETRFVNMRGTRDQHSVCFRSTSYERSWFHRLGSPGVERNAIRSVFGDLVSKERISRMANIESGNDTRLRARRPSKRTAAIRFFCAAGVVLLAWASPVLAQAASGGGTASGGSLGSSAASPGTNSAGTAAPSGGGATGGSVATGTGDPMTDKQGKQVDKKIKSICKGC